MQEGNKTVYLDFDNITENYGDFERKWRLHLTKSERKRYLRMFNHHEYSDQFYSFAKVAWWGIALYELFVFCHPGIVITLLSLVVAISLLHVCYDEVNIELFWQHHGLEQFIVENENGKAENNESKE